jgi:hypothetical protein
MLYIHLHLGLPSGLFPSGFPTNNLYKLHKIFYQIYIYIVDHEISCKMYIYKERESLCVCVCVRAQIHAFDA